ncbi:DUF389 domain-containing protein [Propionivibrio sp.]|uniref:DUF389 domain-containing protein n=1 Tax=Propionivibrio sp. TaxID=2212460 RepID=UPI00344F2E39
MPITPLMGPIIGAGYGAGIHDFALIRKALRNLAIFVSISLFVHRKVGRCAPAKCTFQASPSDAMKRLNNWACVATPSFSLMRAR